MVECHGFSQCVSHSARCGIQKRGNGEKAIGNHGAYLLVVDADDALTSSDLFIAVKLNSSFDKPNRIGYRARHETYTSQTHIK